jgi:hypothetical protein
MRLILCFCSLILVNSSSALADPISWDYSATFAGDRGSAYVGAGVGFRPDMEPNGASSVRYFQGYTQLTPSANLGPQTGSVIFTIGTTPGSSDFFWAEDPTSPPSVPVDDAPVPGGKVDSQFKAELTIHDHVSGQSGTVSIMGTATSSDSWLGLPADLNLPDATGMWGGGLQELVLGENRYQIAFGERKINPRTESGFLVWDSLEVVAEVRVSPLVQTPEPASFVLGLMGIGLAGTVRRRKSGVVA